MMVSSPVRTIISSAATTNKAISKERSYVESAAAAGSELLGTDNSLRPVDLARRNMNFEIGDFHVSSRFRSFIQTVVVPDGLIQSRLERMAECILRDLGSEHERKGEVSILVSQDNSLKFYRDLQKKLSQRSMHTTFKAYLIKDTYVRTAQNVVERVWKIVLIKPGSAS